MQIERKRDAGALVWVQSLQLSAALPADGAPYHDEQLTRKLPPSGQAAAPPSTVCGTGRVWTRLSISATTWSSYLNHGYLLPMFMVSRWVIDQSYRGVGRVVVYITLKGYQGSPLLVALLPPRNHTMVVC